MKTPQEVILMDKPKTREEMSKILAEALADAGVPPESVHRAVKAVMSTLATEHIEDAIAAMVDKRMNKLHATINTIVEDRLKLVVCRHFSEAKIKNLVGKEAERIAKNLYEFMLNRPGVD